MVRLAQTFLLVYLQLFHMFIILPTRHYKQRFFEVFKKEFKCRKNFLLKNHESVIIEKVNRSERRVRKVTKKLGPEPDDYAAALSRINLSTSVDEIYELVEDGYQHLHDLAAEGDPQVDELSRLLERAQMLLAEKERLRRRESDLRGVK